MKKNVTTKKDIIQLPNNCISTRGQNKKINHNITSSSTALLTHSNINNNLLSSKQNKANNFTNNNNLIYDKEFISYINKLSDIIKTLHKTNNANFSIMKNILEKSNNNNVKNNNNKQNKNNNNNDNNLNSINSSFNNIESDFNNFYNNAIVLFQKMKSYKETAENKRELLNLNNNKTKGNSLLNSKKKKTQ